MPEHENHEMQETSLLSFEEMRDKLTARHKEIYHALMDLCEIQGDATDQEIKEYLEQDDANYVRPRRYELVNNSNLKCVGLSRKRTCSVTGKRSCAWKVLRKINHENRKMQEVQETERADETFANGPPFTTL